LISLEIEAKTYRVADSSGSRTIRAANADEAVQQYQRLERIPACCRGRTVAEVAAALESYGDWLVVHEDGEIIYSDSTGLPKHYLAGHDVEEFVGVVKRWGPSKNVKRLIEVAKNPPFVSNLDISKCCGNCVIN
jgi:hypothetical protein